MKKRPKTLQTMVSCVRNGQSIDRRTKQGKAISQVKEAVRSDLDKTAIALLEDDVANAAVIQQMALATAFKDPSKVIDTEGNYHRAIGTWMKFSNVKRASLVALKRFQQQKPDGKSKEPGLGDLILEVSGNDQGE